MLDMLIQSYRVFFLFLYEHLGFTLAILITSMISTFLMKPIAKFIMKYVKREQAYQAILQPQIDEINASDKGGAEKQFALQRLYNRYGYSPILATRKVLPLFVQLPFLMVTYWMLDGCSELDGVRFLCFANLGAADALLSFDVNLLPFVMTGINFVAIFATPSFTKKDQIQAIVVALLFLVLLYPASSALMIYWTLNNFFTCVKTLLEENHAGAKLLLKRLRYVFAPSIFYLMWCKVKNINTDVYTVAVLIFLLLAHHSYIVFTGKYGEASLSGKVAANTMNLFLSTALMFAAFAWKRMRVLWLLIAGILFLAHIGIIADKVLIRSEFLFGKHPVILRYFFYFQVVVVGCRLIIRQFCASLPWQRRFSGIEIVSYVCLIFAIACHYLCANTLLGLSFSSFVLFPIYLIGIFVLLSLSGYILLGRSLSLQSILRVIFSGCVVFYLMPLFAKGTGVFFPSQNIWLYWVVFIIVGLAFGWLLLYHKQFFLVFLAFTSLSLIANGVYAVFSSRETADLSVLQNPKESFSHLDNHKIMIPYNIYVLIYDGWPNPLIAEAYNVYNPLPYLRKRGFTVYPQAYMPCKDTVNSMSRFFDIFRDTHLPVRDILAGRAKCLRFLRANNYRMSYMADAYCFAGAYLPLEGDYYFPDPTGGMTVLIEDVLIRNIRHGFLNQTTEDFQEFTVEERAKEKLRVLALKDSRPQFVYAHSGPGHTVTNEKLREAEEVEFAAFLKRVEVSKVEMVKDLDSIADWDNSIIIVASDHGAYLNMKENVSEARRFLDQYACLLAVKWPENYTPTMDVSFAPNVMLEVMICLTGDKSLAQYKQRGVIWGGPGGSGYHILDSFSDGISLKGPNKGKNLFDVAEEELKARRVK